MPCYCKGNKPFLSNNGIKERLLLLSKLEKLHQNYYYSGLSIRILMQKLSKDFKDYQKNMSKIMSKIHIVYTEELGNKEKILEPKDYAKE